MRLAMDFLLLWDIEDKSISRFKESIYSILSAISQKDSGVIFPGTFLS